MSLTNAAETDLLELIFNATTWLTLAQDHATPLASLYISLHTGDPGETGSQTTSEAAYTSYARVAVARTTAGWTVTGNTASNTAAITFPACTGSSSTVTHFGIGTALTGAGNLLASGQLTASLAISAGITPQFAIGDLDVTAD